MNIQNGFILDKNYSLYELNNIIEEIRTEIIEESETIFNKLLAEITVDIYDNYKIRDFNSFKDLLNIRYKHMCPLDTNYVSPYIILMELIKNKANIKLFSKYNLQCDLIIHPLKDKILIQVFTNNFYYKEIFKNNPKFISYNFCNDYPQEEDIFEKEWKQRKKDWNKVFPISSSIKNKNKLKISLFDIYSLHPYKTKFKKFILKYKEKIIIYSRDIISENILLDYYNNEFSDKHYTRNYELLYNETKEKINKILEKEKDIDYYKLISSITLK